MKRQFVAIVLASWSLALGMTTACRPQTAQNAAVSGVSDHTPLTRDHYNGIMLKNTDRGNVAWTCLYYTENSQPEPHGFEPTGIGLIEKGKQYPTKFFRTIRSKRLENLGNFRSYKLDIKAQHADENLNPYPTTRIFLEGTYTTMDPMTGGMSAWSKITNEVDLKLGDKPVKAFYRMSDYPAGMDKVTCFRGGW